MKSNFCLLPRPTTVNKHIYFSVTSMPISYTSFTNSINFCITNFKELLLLSLTLFVRNNFNFKVLSKQFNNS